MHFLCCGKTIAITHYIIYILDRSSSVTQGRTLTVDAHKFEKFLSWNCDGISVAVCRHQLALSWSSDQPSLVSQRWGSDSYRLLPFGCYRR